MYRLMMAKLFIYRHLTVGMVYDYSMRQRSCYMIWKWDFDEKNLVARVFM